MKTSKPHYFTAAQLDFLREKYKKYSLPVLAWALNETFCLALSESQVRGALRNHHIKSGRTGQFRKEDAPWNLGKKGYMGANKTSFKTGNLPHNHQPLWTERVDKNGYIEMSVPERNPYTGFPTRYKHKHVWIWEQAHGPKPKGTAVIFKDGDNRNFYPDNLLLVTRTELLVMNQHGYKALPIELKPSVLALVKVEVQAGFRTRPGRGRQRG
jgi:hypothetical protein